MMKKEKLSGSIPRPKKISHPIQASEMAYNHITEKAIEKAIPRIDYLDGMVERDKEQYSK